MKTIPLPNNVFTLVDDDDYSYLSKHKWNVTPHGYVQRFDYSEYPKRSTVTMHRLIMGNPVESQIDHINGDKLDNRKENLRIANRNQNAWNVGKHSNNKSGLKGVYFHKATGKWASSIRANGKRKHLGLFDTKEGAYEAYCRKAVELHGEFARF